MIYNYVMTCSQSSFPNVLCMGSQQEQIQFDAITGLSVVFYLLSVMSSAVLGLSAIYDVESELVEVMSLLCPPETKRARLEIFCLPSAITIGKTEIHSLCDISLRCMPTNVVP